MRHLYQNSEVIYCAESLDQCWELFIADMPDITREEEEPLDPFVQIPDTEELEICGDEEEGLPGEYRKVFKGEHVETVLFCEKHLAAQWAECETGYFSRRGS